MDKKKIGYVNAYLKLSCFFNPHEFVFILNMVNINCLRSGGYNTVWGKKFLMSRMNLGLRKFDHCVKRMTELGLLERKPVNGMYDYCWNMDLYSRVIEIISVTDDLKALSQFGERVFKIENRNIASITDKDIDDLRKIGEKFYAYHNK